MVFRCGQDGVGWRAGSLGQTRRVGTTHQPCSRQLHVWTPGAPLHSSEVSCLWDSLSPRCNLDSRAMLWEQNLAWLSRPFSQNCLASPSCSVVPSSSGEAHVWETPTCGFWHGPSGCGWRVPSRVLPGTGSPCSHRLMPHCLRTWLCRSGPNCLAAVWSPQPSLVGRCTTCLGLGQGPEPSPQKEGTGWPCTRAPRAWLVCKQEPLLLSATFTETSIPPRSDVI